MAIFTAALPEHCMAALDRHGIGEWFTGILYAQALETGKERPETFHAVADMLGARPEACAYFDDSAAACRAARAAGMAAIGVRDDHFQNETEVRESSDLFIESFSAGEARRLDAFLRKRGILNDA